MTTGLGLTCEQTNSLGMQSQHPAAVLLPWIELYYVVNAVAPVSGRTAYQDVAATARSADSTRLRLYPDGGASLNLYWSGSLITKVSVAHQPNQLRYYSPATEKVISIRFAPGGLYGIFGLHADEWTGEHFFWPDDNQWLGQLCSALQDEQPVVWPVLDHFFIQQARQRRLEAGLVQQWLACGVQHPLPYIRQQLQQFGGARRTLERVFQREVGIAPGQLYQLQRIKWARTLLWQQPELPVVDIALQCHFYDQAHFVHQFSAYTDQSPSQYRQRKLSQLYKEN